MRELRVVTDHSSDSRIVLRWAETALTDESTGEMFELPVTDELRALISPNGDGDSNVAESAATGTETPVEQSETNSPSQGPDPRLSKPLPMTPREIQQQIRRGATVAEVAKACDIPESRITPFAHPVLQERSQIAELAKASRPVRSDGPCPLTLAELAATALSAQGHDVAAARWDAYRNASNQWIISLSYGETPDETTATWTLMRSGGSHSTVANDAAAQVITEPTATRSIAPEDRQPEPEPTTADGDEANAPEPYGQDVLIPDLEGAAPVRRRKRKAETPHWEDVLLSVRGSTKRPRK